MEQLKSIVILSPHRDLATLISEAIGTPKERIIHCSTIEQAIEACQSKKPALVIVLGIRPFIDGSQLIQQIRTKGARWPQIYVVAWQQSEQAVVALLESGVNQYMTFPICIGRLRNKISALDEQI